MVVKMGRQSGHFLWSSGFFVYKRLEKNEELQTSVINPFVKAFVWF